MNKKKVKLAILNITSYTGQCSGATHVYGKLILCTQKDVTLENISQYNIKYLAKNNSFEIRRPLTKKLAKELDKKGGGNTYQRHFRIIEENPDMLEEMSYFGYTEKFDTIPQVVDAGIAKWKKLDINCPFISLYEGEIYKPNKYEASETVILHYKKKDKQT